MYGRAAPAVHRSPALFTRWYTVVSQSGNWEGLRMDADTCLRCGAPYSPGQTVCFKCGAPLGETRPNTQPVPAIKIPQPEESAPPAAEPAPSLPVARVASATAEPPAPPTQRKRRRWPLLALVVVLVLAAGGGGFYL